MILRLSFILSLSAFSQCAAYDVVYAINCGGREFLDSQGISYDPDPVREGFTSNYGSRYAINRVPAEDAPLYQTERYSTSSLSYTIPLSGEGKYLLVLKFAEVFFEAAHQKVFDVLLNDVHPVVSDLDIFSLVGHATAHDEYISFSVSRGKLFVRDRVSDVRGGRLKVTFAKGQYDNPKVNAILLLKGVDVNEFPRLPPLSETTRKRAPPRSATKTTTSQFIEESENNFLNDEEQEEQHEQQRKPRRTSGPKQPDPYEGMDSWMITIGFIVVATIIPVVILRCRL